MRVTRSFRTRKRLPQNTLGTWRQAAGCVRSGRRPKEVPYLCLPLRENSGGPSVAQPTICSRCWGIPALNLRPSAPHLLTHSQTTCPATRVCQPPSWLGRHLGLPAILVGLVACGKLALDRSPCHCPGVLTELSLSQFALWLPPSTKKKTLTLAQPPHFKPWLRPHTASACPGLAAPGYPPASPSWVRCLWF